MKKVYMLFMISILSLTACSASSASPTTATIPTETTVSPTTEDSIQEIASSTEDSIQEIEDISHDDKITITDEGNGFFRSSYQDEFRALECGSSKVLYEAAPEDNTFPFDESKFFQAVYNDGFKSQYVNKILAKEWKLDNSWDVYVLDDEFNEVYWFNYNEKRTVQLDKFTYDLFEETVLPEVQRRYEATSGKSEGYNKYITAEEMKNIYPDLPWDAQATCPTKVKLYKSHDGRCSVTISYPRIKGAGRLGIESVDSDVNSLFTRDHIAWDAMVADYYYLVHDLYTDTIHVYFSDYAYKGNWDYSRVEIYSISEDGKTFREVGLTKNGNGDPNYAKYDFR